METKTKWMRANILRNTREIEQRDGGFEPRARHKYLTAFNTQQKQR